MHLILSEQAAFTECALGAFAGYKTLVPSNLQQASDLAVANLYWYFKVRDESEELKEIDDVGMPNQKIVLSEAK